MRNVQGADWEKDFTAVIVRNLAAVREDAGLTIEQFARRCDEVLGEPGKFKPNTLQGLFAGKRKNVTYAELVVFARALGVPLASLLVPVLTSERIPTPDSGRLTPAEWWEELALSSRRTVRGGGDWRAGQRAQHASVVVRDAAQAIHELRSALSMYQGRADIAEGDPSFRSEILAETVRRGVLRVQTHAKLLDAYNIELNVDDPLVAWALSVDGSELEEADIASASDWTAGWLDRGRR